MNRHLRRTVVGLGLIVALAWLSWLVRGCFSVEWSSDGSGGGGEPGTKYFVLEGPPLRFQASRLGLKPELGDYGGGLHCVSLDQFEMNFGDLKGWSGDFVAVKHADGRCAEIAIYCQGIVCRRYTFDYDAVGRTRRRTDTEYELRREGEGTLEWAARLKGRTPAVACVREIEYAWSEDGRTVDITLRVVRGKPHGLPPISLPKTPGGEPGQRLETWRLNNRGLITSVLRGDVEAYSAQYDDAGRLLGYETEGGEKVENHYDAQGCLLETRIRYSIGIKGIIVHAYPGGPSPKLPIPDKPGENHSFLITHDKEGRVSRIRTREGEDAMGNTFEEFRRDKDGRIIWRRVGFAW